SRRIHRMSSTSHVAYRLTRPTSRCWRQPTAVRLSQGAPGNHPAPRGRPAKNIAQTDPGQDPVPPGRHPRPLQLDRPELLDDPEVLRVCLDPLAHLVDAVDLRVAEEPRRLREVRDARRIDAHEARARRVDRDRVVAEDDDADGARVSLDRAVALHAEDAVDD